MGRSEDADNIVPEQTQNPRTDTTESAGPAGWLSALNSFLERAFLTADVDTGC